MALAGLSKTQVLLLAANITVAVFLLYNQVDRINMMDPSQEVRLSGQPRWSQQQIQIMKQFRKTQAAQVESLLALEVEALQEEEAMDRFYHEVSTPLQGVCHSLKRVGGRWLPTNQAVDGDKFICLDSFSSQHQQCLVYSFGIRDDWDFEDFVDSLNCTVHGHDPSVSFPASRGRDTTFHRVGVAPERSQGGNMDTLQHLLKMNGHQDSSLFYLKVDVEGAELTSLPEWLESGVLARVEQLAMELHLPSVHSERRFSWLLGILQELYKLGFRVISHEVNMTVKSTTSGYYSYLEVVLMKDNVWNFLDKA